MYLAENLKFLREQRGKTQQELAKLFGVEQKTLSSWECGSRTPAIGMIVEMAKYYEVSLDDLVLTDMKPPIPVYALNIAYLRKKYGMTQAIMGMLSTFGTSLDLLWISLERMLRKPWEDRRLTQCQMRQ